MDVCKKVGCKMMYKNSNGFTLDLNKRIGIYFVIMLVGVCLRTYVTHSVTIVWIVNIIGLAFLFFPYLSINRVSNSVCAFFYVAFGILTIVINLEYISGSLKSIGTNINIIVFPIMLVISDSYANNIGCLNDKVIKLFKFLSILGSISVIFTWVTSFNDIMQVFHGTSAYKVEVAGFYYSKNIYGAFVSLTLASDLYLLAIDKDVKRLLILILKFVAVVLSFSRAALLQAGVMLFIFFCTKKKKQIKDYVVQFIVIITVIILIVIIVTNDDLVNFIKNGVFRFSSGDAGREMLRNQAIERVGSGTISAVFGVGFAGIEALDIDIDNTYLYLWFTGGIVKLIFFSWALVLGLRKVIRLKHKNENLYRICFSVGISYLFFAFFESVAVLELGILNFLFTIYMFMIPFSYGEKMLSE